MSEACAAGEVDALVVGGGPSGLSAACALRAAGVDRVTVLDRESEAGGVPRHCHHTGFGVRDLRRVLTGPRYARAWVERAQDAGVTVLTSSSVTGWAAGEGLVVEVTSPRGRETVAAQAVVLATGARERPRSARLVPGDRGAGIWTTGMLQQAVYLQRLPVGRRAVVVGAEHVSFSALLTLDHAGVEVVAMVTDHERHQSFPAFSAAATLRYAVPLLRRTRLTRIVGRRRVEAVELTRTDGAVVTVACDTVVLTGDWIPENELARRGGLLIDPGSRGPRTDTGWRTSRPGVFAVGNLVHPVLTADESAVRARDVAAGVRARLDRPGDADAPPWPVGVALVPAPTLRWVTPQTLVGDRAPGGRITFWPNGFADTTVEARQGSRLLGAWWRRLVPNRPSTIPDGWLREVDPGGPDVVLAVRR